MMFWTGIVIAGVGILASFPMRARSGERRDRYYFAKGKYGDSAVETYDALRVWDTANNWELLPILVVILGMVIAVLS